jgi:amidase
MRELSLDITSLSATALSTAIHARQITCAAVMRAFLDRAGEINPAINAIVSLRDAEALMTEAVAADRELDEGRSRGFLHGMPFAIKDLSEAKGIRCTYGSPIYRDFVPDFDDIHVERIRAAGAVIIGKTNAPEKGLGSHTYNPVFGITRNPYDLSKSAGGSSGGAAAALAARLLPLADGSDMMGSLRNPAAFNNVIGMRPSRGRVPGDPEQELFFQQLGTEGPMGRTVEDTARLLAVQAGFDARVPLSSPHALPSADAIAFDGDGKGLRIGWLGSLWPELPLAPGIRELGEKALDTFRAIGCEVEPCTLDVPREHNWSAWLRLRQLLVGGKLGAYLSDPQLFAQLKPEAQWEIEQSRHLDAASLYQASLYRSNVYRAFLRLFERFDFVLAPTAQVFPFDAELHWPAEVAGVPSDTYHRWMEIVTPFTLAGLPTLNVRAGFGEGRLPMGLQLAGPVHADLDVLRLGHAYDQACGWALHRPSALA